VGAVSCDELGIIFLVCGYERKEWPVIGFINSLHIAAIEPRNVLAALAYDRNAKTPAGVGLPGL
jgi:hypothetical protein